MKTEKYVVTAKGGLFYVGLYTRESIDGTLVEKIDTLGAGDWLRPYIEQEVAKLNRDLSKAALAAA